LTEEATTTHDHTRPHTTTHDHTKRAAVDTYVRGELLGFFEGGRVHLPVASDAVLAVAAATA